MHEALMGAFALEASTGLRRLAEPIPAGDKVKAQIARAARLSGLSYWRTFDLWYSKARRIDAAELAAIREAQLKRSRGDTDARNEIAVLRSRLAELEQKIARQDLSAAQKLPSMGRQMASRSSRMAD